MADTPREWVSITAGKGSMQPRWWGSDIFSFVVQVRQQRDGTEVARLKMCLDGMRVRCTAEAGREAFAVLDPASSTFAREPVLQGGGDASRGVVQLLIPEGIPLSVVEERDGADAAGDSLVRTLYATLQRYEDSIKRWGDETDVKIQKINDLIGQMNALPV